MKKEVVVTGLGILTPMEHGNGVDSFFKGLCLGKNKIKPLKSIDTTGFKCNVGGEILDLNNASSLIDNNSRCTKFLELVCMQAIQDSKLDIECQTVGISFGTILGPIDICQKEWNSSSKKFKNCLLSSVTESISKKWNFSGPNLTISTACSSSADAIGLAMNEIIFGRADVMIAGGADILTEFMYRGFSALGALTSDGCVRPFSKNRMGLAIAEGAGVIVLESLENAVKRDAKIYCKLTGYGTMNDAYHLIRPHKDGLGLANAMIMALEMGKLNIDNIDYINAHGTGTFYNDLSETRAIKKVFGNQSLLLKISSIKSMIGHAMGASSIIELICCIMVLKQGIIPPTINYLDKDIECDLDYTPNIACEKIINRVMSLSAGFGGQNSVLIAEKME